MKRHRTDGVSLTFAVLLLCVVATWLFSDVADMGLPGAGWLVAGALIFFGIAGLAGTVRGSRSKESKRKEPAPDEFVDLS